MTFSAASEEKKWREVNKKSHIGTGWVNTGANSNSSTLAVFQPISPFRKNQGVVKDDIEMCHDNGSVSLSSESLKMANRKGMEFESESENRLESLCIKIALNSFNFYLKFLLKPD